MQVGFDNRARRAPRRRAPIARNVLRPLRLLGLGLTLVVLAPALSVSASVARHHSASAALTTYYWRIRAGSTLRGGALLVSPNGQNRFVMQRDGNLVLYWEHHAMWASRTAGHSGAYAVMQTDGNFVIYLGKHAIWSSASAQKVKSAGYYLAVQDDGNVVIYPPRGWAIWRTGTGVGTGLQLGSTGRSVYVLQTHLSGLGYWLGSVNSVFGDSTQQAVYALQKAAGLARDGVVGASTAAAIIRAAVPSPRAASGNLIEVNLGRDLLMILRNGKLYATLNTSTGGGYWYTSQGVTSQAITPTGIYHIFSQIDGLDNAPLGQLWRPKFFTGGYAIHGDSYVPPYPVSHGCVRVSNEAIDWIWGSNQAPIGTEVWIF